MKYVYVLLVMTGALCQAAEISDKFAERKEELVRSLQSCSTPQEFFEFQLEHEGDEEKNLINGVIKNALSSKDQNFKDTVLSLYIKHNSRKLFLDEIIECVEAGANQNLVVAVTDDGMEECPLSIIAGDQGSVSHTESLLRSNVDMNVMLYNWLTKEREPLLSRVTNVGVAKLLLAKEANVNARSEKTKRTVLHCAAIADFHFAKLLSLYLDHGAIINSVDEAGDTTLEALLLNISKGHQIGDSAKNKIDILLRYGAKHENILEKVEQRLKEKINTLKSNDALPDSTLYNVIKNSIEIFKEDYRRCSTEYYPLMKKTFEGQIESQKEIARLGSIEID